MDVMTGLSAIQQIMEITKEFRQIDGKVNVAEFKLRLSDMVDRLLEAKEALQDAREEQRTLVERIRDLEAKISRKSKLEDVEGLLFEVDGSGNRKGEPFCNQCFVKEEKLYRLVYGPYFSGSHQCHNCNGVYGKRTPEMGSVF